MSALLLKYEIAKNNKIKNSNYYDTSNCFILENKITDHAAGTINCDSFGGRILIVDDDADIASSYNDSLDALLNVKPNSTNIRQESSYLLLFAHMTIINTLCACLSIAAGQPTRFPTSTGFAADILCRLIGLNGKWMYVQDRGSILVWIHPYFGICCSRFQVFYCWFTNIT